MDSPWKEPVRGGHPNPSLFGLSGLEQLRAMLGGHVPQAPIGRLTGMRPTEVGAGSAAFAMPASGWLASPQGPLPIGVLAVLADGPLGCAPVDLKVNFLRPARTDGRDLTATGRVANAGRIVVADAEVVDADGKIVAIARGSAVVRPGKPASLTAAAEPLAEEADAVSYPA